jgi:muramoyltetrapeptide carboxypeptidase LdcA involved in peptidoglycan recycling
VELVIHDQCFEVEGHFAGSDARRIAALVECANDSSVDAVWFARGGYGACRVAETAIAKFTHDAQAKTFLGYSDAGYLLGGLYRARIAAREMTFHFKALVVDHKLHIGKLGSRQSDDGLRILAGDRGGRCTNCDTGHGSFLSRLSGRTRPHTEAS